MFTIDNFKVELINKEDVKNYINRHGRFASVCYDTNEKYADKVGESCLKSGHLSGSRHLYFEFKITGVPRSLIDQLVRQEQGVNKNVQSFRYVNKENVNIYVAPEIKDNEMVVSRIEFIEKVIKTNYSLIVDDLKKQGYTNEQSNEIARTVIPIGQESALNIAFNIEGLMRLTNVRLCKRAEYPIRTLTKMMIDEVLKVEPRYKQYLVPQCIKYGHCPEGKHGCGKFKEIVEEYK